MCLLAGEWAGRMLEAPQHGGCRLAPLTLHCALRTLEEAASVPVVYSTAYYALVVRGRMQRGETVLVHSGSGGVGQAAIAIALSMGCRVFTTVGKAQASASTWPARTSQQGSLTSLPRLGGEAGVPPGQVPPAGGLQLCQLPGHVV